MSIDRLKQSVKRMREQTAELVAPGFSYYQQALIRRVFKSVVSQMTDKSDVSIAKEILEKTEWLDG